MQLNPRTHSQPSRNNSTPQNHDPQISQIAATTTTLALKLAQVLMPVIVAVHVILVKLRVLEAVLAVPHLRAVVQRQSVGRVLGVRRLAADVEQRALGSADLPVFFERVLGFPVADLRAGVVDDVDGPVEVGVAEGGGGDCGCLLDWGVWLGLFGGKGWRTVDADAGFAFACFPLGGAFVEAEVVDGGRDVRGGSRESAAREEGEGEDGLGEHVGSFGVDDWNVCVVDRGMEWSCS